MNFSKVSDSELAVLFTVYSTKVRGLSEEYPMFSPDQLNTCLKYGSNIEVIGLPMIVEVDGKKIYVRSIGRTAPEYWCAGFINMVAEEWRFFKNTGRVPGTVDRRIFLSGDRDIMQRDLTGLRLAL